ncbi:tryptophanyl-tRNA synthetase [Dendryphion nanum]|uniref:Tryptophan--tRNA ligase, mitochondrial n=1 Tax=Dendryphion nanum TaxID=256645 RepID=A0A9P9DPQ7_9PLEO|nr:tryptophanyl-tRNA synthetase [Dendryphion nanum]
MLHLRPLHSPRATSTAQSCVNSRRSISGSIFRADSSFRYTAPATATTFSPHASKVIFSGIQPTGIPHLGNYLGALRQWVKLQDESKPQDTSLLFSIVDLHAVTIKQDPRLLQQWRKEMMASLMAVGIDPGRSVIFSQSQVPHHSELMWLLSCIASTGSLSRMTQWKSKMSLSPSSSASPFDINSNSKSHESLKLGLFSYPVLQAADILLYRTTHVPVGEDQAQHLEFTRDLASAFNHAYPSREPIFTLPETILAPAKRVMSLADPTKKMSKSDPNPNSRILITDTRADITKKIRSALTDSIEGISYDRSARPGVSNLIDILYHLDESIASSPADLASDLSTLSMRALKEKVADAIDAELQPVREKYGSVIATDNERPFLYDQSTAAARAAEEIAGATLGRVKVAMGLGQWDI